MSVLLLGGPAHGKLVEIPPECGGYWRVAHLLNLCETFVSVPHDLPEMVPRVEVEYRRDEIALPVQRPGWTRVEQQSIASPWLCLDWHVRIVWTTGDYRVLLERQMVRLNRVVEQYAGVPYPDPENAWARYRLHAGPPEDRIISSSRRLTGLLQEWQASAITAELELLDRLLAGRDHARASLSLKIRL